MKRVAVFAAVFVSAVCLVSAVQARASHHTGSSSQQPHIVTFDRMYGVDGPFIGPANAIRSIQGDELPWEVEKFIHGRLDTNGRLRIQVRGLVFADDASVPPELRGKNDEEKFRGAVSCMSETTAGAVVTDNVITAGFPADVEGNSDIDAAIELPKPCLAPIIFVLAGSEDKWFAVTGFEEEE